MIEPILLSVLAVGMIVGLGTAFFTPDYYNDVVSAEDGLMEWITALALAVAGFVCLWRMATRSEKGLRFVLVMLFGALILLFGAGEEISWGQRVFGWASGEFWQENNAQAETNLHNMMVGDVKVNRVLFGVILTLVFVLYFVALPYFKSKSAGFSKLIDDWYIPVPRKIHSVVFVISLVAMSLSSANRAPELGEFALGLLLLAVVLRPENSRVFS